VGEGGEHRTDASRVRGHFLFVETNPSPGFSLTLETTLSHKGREDTEYVAPLSNPQ
jgi:hypothetical protein